MPHCEAADAADVDVDDAGARHVLETRRFALGVVVVVETERETPVERWALRRERGGWIGRHRVRRRRDADAR